MGNTKFTTCLLMFALQINLGANVWIANKSRS